MNTCDDFLAMKQDPPRDVGDEPLEENQILRKKIILASESRDIILIIK